MVWNQWGDHAFYPYFYSIQAHYLIEPFELHPLSNAAIVAGFLLGYTIFRQANNQKDEFKRIGAKAKIWGRPATTTSDGRLLTAGWWGTRCPLLYGLVRRRRVIGWVGLTEGCSLPRLGASRQLLRRHHYGHLLDAALRLHVANCTLRAQRYLQWLSKKLTQDGVLSRGSTRRSL